MDAHRSPAIAIGETLTRQEWLRLLRASRRAGEHRFSRRMAEAWLDQFPGDLGFRLANAEAQWADDRADLAVIELKRISNCDPEFAEAQIMLAHLEKINAFPNYSNSLGNVAVLTGRFQDEPGLPLWAVHTREFAGNPAPDLLARQLHIIDSEPPSPLPALAILSHYLQSDDQERYSDFASEMTVRWPDCLQFQLAEADCLMKTRQEEEAVRRLHQVVVQDLTGQVAARTLGLENPYRLLWPTDLYLKLELPIPAPVAFAMGWNQLASGTHSPSRPRPAPRVKSSGESQPVHHEEYIEIQEELDRLAQTLNRPDITRGDGRYPALIILTSRARLETKFGSAAFAQIHSELANLAHATHKMHSWGCHVVYVDGPDLQEKWGLQPPSLDPWSIKHTIHDLDTALNSSGERIGALFIIGGDEIIPFHMLPNPVDDDDVQVASDNPYATNDSNYFIPLWPVGRLPTTNDSNAAQLLAQLRKITASRQQLTTRRQHIPAILVNIMNWLRRRTANKSLGMSAQVWQRASHAVYRTIGRPERLAISPAISVSPASGPGKGHTSLGYYNLHGLSDAPEWFGQRDPLESPTGPDYPVALHPNQLGPEGITHSVVFTEACYGAHTRNKSADDSIALKLLSTGTQAIVGSTCISYGSIGTPLIAADLLGRYFWANLNDGHTVGEALQRAKIHLAREMDSRQGYLDGEDQKTLISFVLFGDPLGALETEGKQPKQIRREGMHLPLATRCARIDSEAGQPPRISEDLLIQVKHLVKGYLPGMANAKITIAEEHTQCSGHDCPTRHLPHAIHPKKLPAHRVVTLTKQVAPGGHSHTQVARITMDKNGEVVKLAVSR